jgi:hypothetical protein
MLWFRKKKRNSDARANRWKSITKDRDTVFRETGILEITPGLRYQILCVRLSPEKAVGALDRTTHIFWVTYKPIKRIQDRAGSNSVCLYSSGLSLVVGDRGDAMAWKIMTIIQRQLNECQTPFFLFHSKTRSFNSNDIHSYWKQNTEAAIKKVRSIVPG